ncbi:MAG: xylulose 5-phosphate 3-epimerase, partial [Neisseriaceae bacterium]|nr:xylulose 5-phosphate 3-epimerase [Neisseriaceae bacterium]
PNKKGKEKPIMLIATGSYQLEAVLRASERLQEVEQSHRVVYLQEPGRFRAPRDVWEEAVCVGNAQREALFPKDIKRRVFVSHMRPEVAIGHLQPLVRSVKKTASLGYINRGGTLDVAGMLFANRCTWAHVLSAAAQVSELPFDEWLSEAEAAAVMGTGDPLTLR